MANRERNVIITDFSGGLVTLAGSLALSSNQTPGILNCIPLLGRLFYRGGFVTYCGLPAKADQIYSFYDSNKTRHLAVWAGGNLYDCVGGLATLIEAGVYAAGQRIGVVDQQGVLYWSSGQPVPTFLRFWNPALGTKGGVTSSGGVGTVNPVASDYLFIYLDSIFALAPTYTTGQYQSNVMIWCNTRDPRTWVALNSQAVGPSNGGKLVFGLVLGIANTGVPTYSNFVIGRDDEGIYAYSGAMPQLHEAQLDCPTGCIDGNTARWLPTSATGVVIFLGRDGQLWQTDGTAAIPLSNAILNLITAATKFYVDNTPGGKFYSGFNEQLQYYWCDIGGIQFVYRWANNAWTLFQGWPSGYSITAPGSDGGPVMYIADSTSNSPKVVVAGVAGQKDGGGAGTMPSVYYDTPYLHGGNMNMFKNWTWCQLATYSTGALYNMQGIGNMRSDGSQMISRVAPLLSPDTTPAGTFNPFILGSSVLGGPDVLGPGPEIPVPFQGETVIEQARFACPVAVSKFMPAGQFETLKANAARIRISWAGGNPTFDVIGIGAFYEEMGYRRGAGKPFDPEAVANQPFDPYANPV